VVLIGCFAFFHALNLSADFPNHSPWISDWAKYTDEGWYGNAAVRAHLAGNWYLPGDFNPAPGVPVWQFVEWLLFFFTGVGIAAARGLAVAFFFCNLLLSYLLLRERGPRWMALLALTLLVTNPFLYCFTRLAILEPLVTTLTLAAMNLAVRLPRMRRPVVAAVFIGLLFTLMFLTKTTALFLLPALGWAMLLPLWQRRRLAVHCAVAAAAACLASFGIWMILVAGSGLLPDYRYLFVLNNWVKPSVFYWPLPAFLLFFADGLWVDHILIPLAGLAVLAAILARRLAWGRKLLLDPVFGASIWAVAGSILFMTYQFHIQPRYFAVVAFFSFFVVAQGAAALATQPGRLRWVGFGFIALALVAAGFNSVRTLNYVTHPEFTFVDAAQGIARYIDTHPNGNRMLVSISGDEISLITHLPALSDYYGSPVREIPDLPAKLAYYRPGWYLAWNELDSRILKDLHTHFSLEQVASFRAFDDRQHDKLVLFKLHPLPNGQVREPTLQNLQVPLPGDKIDIPIQ
jgi:4-amino-4-deoxy-L-arabinose transferase-like glycosyltransferase